MSRLLRHYSPGGIYFVTSVTYGRAKILVDAAETLLGAMRRVECDVGCRIVAWVIMPDHVHLMIDPAGGNLSGIMRKIKLIFGHQYRSNSGLKNERIWQNRFWDHRIRDRNDMNKHIDYIHFSPVKHGYVRRPADWKLSSFSEYVQRGAYSMNWGAIHDLEIEGNFGE